MKSAKLWVLLLTVCATFGTGGCAMFESEVTYNPYARNDGEKPVLRATEEVLNAPEDGLNWFDRRFENTVY